jgi:hypothetical protein
MLLDQTQPPNILPSQPVNPQGDHHLDAAVQWSNQRRNLRFPPPAQEQNPKWDWLIERGLGNWEDYQWIYRTIVASGLDCVLEIDELPAGNDFFWNFDSVFWTDHKYNLLKIKTRPGPLWLNFIASDYRREDPDWPFHLSLCYRKELWAWFQEDRNEEKIKEWIRRYRVIQNRYHGRRARLMTNQNLTSGHTFVISTDTRVEGLRPPHVVSDEPGGDQDVEYVHKLPGHIIPEKEEDKGKADQDLHVSLIVSP